MISRLKIQNKIDMYEFCLRCRDKYEDWYITKNKSRLMINNLSLIETLLQRQEVYGLFQGNLKAVMIIVRDKGFRPYIKLLAENSRYTIDMLKFLKWNFSEKDLYFKLKKENPLIEQIKKTGFVMIGDRGRELLFLKKGIKQLYKMTPKDDYLPKQENRLY